MKAETFQSKIGSLIAEFRQQQGMTQSELAKKIHTSQSAVARIEKGEQNISTEMLLKVSSALKRDLITFVGQAIDFKVVGGKKLQGTVAINGSKNAAVALLCAALLNKGTTILHNMPNIAEVERIIEVLESMDVSVQWNEHTVVITPPTTIGIDAIDVQAAKKTRSVLMLIGSLVHYFESFSLPQAGGCRLGARSVMPHFFALESFGVDIQTTQDAYVIAAPKLRSAEVILYETGDTVTENALLAAALLPGTSVIKYASANYMVQDLCLFLQQCGVEIEGVGTSTLIVHGVEEINQTVEYTISEDPIEAMFFIAAAIVTKSRLTISRCPIDFLELELLKLKKMNQRFQLSAEYKSTNGYTRLVDITVLPSKLIALSDKIHSLPYPGINADNVPFFVPIATQATGRTLIHDWVYEDRVKYFTEMNTLGADVVIADLHRAYITGPTQLKSANIICPPALRPAAIILIGMLAADGTSILRNVYSISRGYEDLAQRLNAIGAEVQVLRSNV